jgi:propanol-preferring alcohol dehydrogenase
MVLGKPASLRERPEPLELMEISRPSPAPQQILIEVSVCGVCHTELDEIEGRVLPPKLPIIPGHEVIGTVVELGHEVTKFRRGDRVGVGWIFCSDGSEEENLSPAFRATGRDVNGGYAEFMIADQDYAFPIPAVFTDEQAAPLLCAGAIGYRALRLTNLKNGQALGLTGFGGSAHIVIQLARHLFPASPVYVFARDAGEREFALQHGAVWAGPIRSQSPEKLQAIIDTTPAWTPVVAAMRNLLPGGRLVINAIRKQENDKTVWQELNYETDLWMEREIKSVANITARDIAEFLPVAASIPIQTTVQIYSLAEANRALVELNNAPIRGAKVLGIGNRRFAGPANEPRN